MKAFVLGALAGALTCFIVIRVSNTGTAHLERSEQLSVAQSRSSDLQVASQLSCPTEPKATSPTVIAGNVDSNKAEQTPNFASTVSRVQSDDRPAIASTRIPIENLSEQEASEICSRAHNLQAARKRAKKDAEPKDPAWAYSMESLIRQHVESQMSADQYTKLEIQCRTTFCELAIEGIQSEQRDRASKLLQEIEHQPWSDIVSWGNGNGSDGRRWHFQYEWRRPQGNEREFLFRMRDERASSTSK